MPNELKENIILYKEVVKNLCELYRHMEIADNIVKVYEYFRYMYLNGYLSCGFFEDGIPQYLGDLERFLTIDVCGFYVIVGHGVCRHTTDFLEHVYSGLDYISSPLFLYCPDTKITINNKSKAFLTNYHAQKFIDEIIKKMDLHGDKEQIVTEDFEGIEVTVEYFPSKIKPNHVVNVVKSKEEERVYILDTRAHSVGKIIDERQIILNNLGLLSVADVELYPFAKFDSSGESDLDIGPMLINNYDTLVDQDVTSSVIYRYSAGEFEQEYKRFKARNQDIFDTIANNLQLAKRYIQ